MPSKVLQCCDLELRHTCTTTMVPTAAAAWAARGEGGSPWGLTFCQSPVRTSMMCTLFVAPASLMPVPPGTTAVCRGWVEGGQEQLLGCRTALHPCVTARKLTKLWSRVLKGQGIAAACSVRPGASLQPATVSERVALSLPGRVAYWLGKKAQAMLADHLTSERLPRQWLHLHSETVLGSAAAALCMVVATCYEPQLCSLCMR